MAEYLTSVDICNKALQHLGAPLIATLADNSKNAVQMNFAYDKCRLAELRSHAWAFSITYAVLAQPTGTNPLPTQEYQNGQFRNRFILPVAPEAYVRMAQQDPHTAGVSNQGVTAGLQWTDYSVESGLYLMTSQTEVSLRYCYDIGLVTQFDPMFCEALAARIAFDTCEVITQNPNKRQQMAQIYSERIQFAQTLNLIETATDEPSEMEASFARINLPMGGVPQPQQGGGRGQR